MPASDLISVDLPAPLSPTRAMTSPSLTSKSTSSSAFTEPKLFETPRSWRVGLSVMEVRGHYGTGASDACARPECDSQGLAVLLVLALADLRLLDEPVRVEQGHVRLRDPRRGQEHRRRTADLLAMRGDGSPLDDRDGGGSSGICLLLDRLVDGARLPAGDDVLHASRRRVLTTQSDRLEAVALQGSDDRTGKTVVRREDAVDLVAVAREHLLEDGLALDRIPVRPLVFGLRLLEGAGRPERVQH